MTEGFVKGIFVKEYICERNLTNGDKLNDSNLNNREHISLTHTIFTGGSGAAATSKMAHFAIIVNGFQPLAITTKLSILDVAAILDTPLIFKLQTPI